MSGALAAGLPLAPPRLDVLRDPLARELAVPLGQSLENRAMLGGRPLERRLRRAGGQRSGRAAVAGDDPDDREPDLVPRRAHDDRVEGAVARPDRLACVRTLLPPVGDLPGL